MNSELENRLRELDAEDIIWAVLIGLIVVSYWANDIERDYLITGNQISKDKYRMMQIFIFGIAVLLYLYYFVDSYQDIFSLKPSDGKKKKEGTYLSFVASLFILLAGLIYLYIAITDQDIEIEISL